MKKTCTHCNKDFDEKFFVPNGVCAWCVATVYSKWNKEIPRREKKI